MQKCEQPFQKALDLQQKIHGDIHGDIQKHSESLAIETAPVMKQHPKGPKPAVAVLSITKKTIPNCIMINAYFVLGF